VRVDATGGHGLGIGCGRLIAADPLRQPPYAFSVSGWVDEHAVVGDAPFEHATVLVRVLLVPGPDWLWYSRARA
jgi:hypothetical protein